MPNTTIHPLLDITVNAFNPVAGTPTGSRISVPSPVRGTLIEAGFMPASLVASAMTLAVALGSQASTTVSTFTNCISSVAAAFSSTNLYEGAIASASPAGASISQVQPGDAIQFTTSGGNTSLIGATMYAIIRKG